MLNGNEVRQIKADLKRLTVETVATNWTLSVGLIRRIKNGSAYRNILG